MCNLNIIVKKTGVDCVQKLSDMTAISYVHNDDGEGAYFSASNKCVTSLKRLDISKYREDIIRSEVVIFHERLATHGCGDKNVQPFQDGRFVFVHNGVFWNVPGEVKEDNWWGFGGVKQKDKDVPSDSKLFFAMFQKEFKKKGDIGKAVDECLDKVNGSYSIFIYDKKEKVGYYFKSSGTSIEAFYAPDGTLVIATNDDAKMFWNVKKAAELDDEVFYKISKDVEGVKVEKLFDIAPAFVSYEEEKTEANPAIVPYKEPLAWTIFATLLWIIGFIVTSPFVIFIKVMDFIFDNFIDKKEIKNGTCNTPHPKKA